LARQPSAWRAERGTHGQFAAPRRASREQQVGDVHAGHEQYRIDRCEQHQQRRAHSLHHVFERRLREGSPAFQRIGMRLLQGRHRRCQFRLRLGEWHVLGQTAEHEELFEIAIRGAHLLPWAPEPRWPDD
jgi:hypothetical protein